MSSWKNDYSKLINEYKKGAKGPYKAEAIVDFFQTYILEDISNISKDIDAAYTNALAKIKLMIADY